MYKHNLKATTHHILPTYVRSKFSQKQHNSNSCRRNHIGCISGKINALTNNSATGAFVAKEIAGDQFHTVARAGWNEVERRGLRLVSSEHVLDESATLI